MFYTAPLCLGGRQGGRQGMTTGILVWLTRYSYIGLFSLLVLGIVGVPLPDEVLLVFAGSLSKPAKEWTSAYLNSHSDWTRARKAVR